MENGKSGRRERKKSEVRDRIINSALKVFLEKSFNETTIVEIMEDADLGTGTFYNYFQSKEDLVTYCVSEKISEAQLVIENIKEKPVLSSELISQILLSIGKVCEENRYIMGLFMQLRRTGQSTAELPPHNNIFGDIFADVFKQGQEKGEFRADIPAEVVAEMIFGIVQSSLVSGNTGISFIENLRIKLNIFFEGVLTKETGNVKETDNAKERSEVNGD